ncbi:bifunctional protein (Includes penicillin-insensitive transglycosylase; penicillin-sensitive transpeptidase) (penicillin-binding protein 1B) [Desulfamplus magnetovallimortis]|uniref:Penicillin-binding protein 1B n=1 Tax=Desulfamplus magnetovallimortis TaxID=1246637 RepID=A0A1W1H5X6_9BACT|nr:penicillin-binding protein 1B [Desulfamplus magnetovallimortis]SLM27844.1 bifunctional protein (Includes penicillin-insensitive transglycosylase; penicillin-sensitive transpeptidase) (penicillin-binding protein 1B) [Desulfamplus magnetovallimortis]
MKKILLLLLLAGAALLFGYAQHFNLMVAEKFQGRPWELPARVYARPLEIYQGLAIAPEMLEKELKLMGYQKSGTGQALSNPGSYSRRGGVFHLFCRPFDFGDEELPGRRIRVTITNDWVTEVRPQDSFFDKDLMRLDPVLMGNFYPSSMEDRVLVSLEQTPDLLGKTIVAVEDRNFYAHYGVDFKGIFRAILVNLKNRQFSQGASTLTQQLAKNFFLSREKKLIRKIKETFMASALERNFSKDEILEAYMNEVYLGQDGKRAIHGFGLAANFYFGKAPASLEIHEIALLVGMLKGPSAYNPRAHPDKALLRRNTVLAVMKDQELISESAMEKASRTPLGVVAKPLQGHNPFPFYLDLVKRELLKEYREKDLKTMGLRIFTALDPQVQLAAENGVAGFMEGRNSSLEFGIVVSAVSTNEIQAMVGGRNFRYQGFNRALDARRPIGSLVKPAVFLTALDRPDQYTMISKLSDRSLRVTNPDGSIWQPQNYDKKSRNSVPLWKALANSLNIATVRLGMDLGLASVATTLEKMGFAPEKPLLPSMLLGSLEKTPVEVAQAYHTLASGGFYTPARAIRAIYTPERETLQRYPLKIEQRLPPGPVFLTTKMLQTVVTAGTGRKLEKWLPRDLAIAGKTGTTNDLRDSWFAGFSANRLAVVWIGRDDNQPTGLTGSTGALQVFGRLMADLSNTALDPAAPDSIEWGVIDPETGRLTDANCPGALAVPFITGSKPDDFAPCQKPIKKESNADQKKQKPKYLIDWLKEVF